MGKVLLRASVFSSVTWGDNRSHLTGLLAELPSVNERCGVYGGKTQSKRWSLGNSKYSLFWGEIAHPLLREPGSSPCPFQAHTPWAPAGDKSSCTSAACHWRALWAPPPPPDTELGEQGPSPTQIARDGRRFLSQRQRNKQIPNHQQGSQHKNQHKPFGKCTNSHDNVACFHPVILPLSHTSKNNPQWGGGWKPRVPGWMFIIYFHRCSVKILGRPKASCKYFKFNNGSQSACLYVFCNETDNLLGKQNKQAHVIISTTREAL